MCIRDRSIHAVSPYCKFNFVRSTVSYRDVWVQIQLLQNHGHHPEALHVYRKLCEAPSDLEPPPRGVSAGLTGRLAAGQSVKYLMRVPDDSEAAALICQSLETWLLKVPVSLQSEFYCK